MLDGMRGVAAFAVMMMHFTNNLPTPLFKTAYLAVDLFFILSGFVIAHSYNEALLSGSMKFLEFFKRRLIRLYPMFFIGLVIGAASLHWAKQWGETHYSLQNIVFASLCNIFFIPYFNNIDGGHIFPLDDPAWSLFFGVFFQPVRIGCFRLA